MSRFNGELVIVGQVILQTLLFRRLKQKNVILCCEYNFNNLLRKYSKLLTLRSQFAKQTNIDAYWNDRQCPNFSYLQNVPVLQLPDIKYKTKTQLHIATS